jgi:CubicO group peptidase (beta-lactamase class C family)
MAEMKVPGVAIGVIAGGKEFSQGFGVTNVDHPLPVDADTLFQVGSITKTYTGTALMRLVERGEIDFEAPVRTYLPGFRVADAGVPEQVRLHHLVTHSAGWFGDDFSDTGDGDDALARYVDGMADLPQLAPLGRFFSYNNAAVVAAGRVIEVVTGRPYEVAARELVLEPLGLNQSFFFPEEVMTEAFAVGHVAPEDDAGGEAVVLRPWAIPRGGNPAGGIASSVADQLRYARFHLGDGTAAGTRLLSTEGLRRMRDPLGPGGAFGSDLVDGVGVTWFLSTIGGARIAFHEGGTNGQQAILALVPDRGFALSLLTNSDTRDSLIDDVTAWTLDRFLGLVRPVAEEVPVASERLLEYVGGYGPPDGRGGTVARDDGVLLLTGTREGRPAGEATELTPIGDDRFVSRKASSESFVDFERDETGKIGWIRLGGRLEPRIR